MLGSQPFAVNVRRVILNADDFGYDPAVTRGIVAAMRQGVVSSTTMIVNSPHSDEAARDAKGLSIGLHVNLVRFAAVSEPSRQLSESVELDPAFVEAEVDAQLERLQRLLGRPATHLDVHKHWHTRVEVFEGLCRVAHRRGLPVRSITAEMRTSLRARGVKTNDVFLGEAGDTGYWTLERWDEHLRQLPASGVIELMCHPGYRPSHVSSGYAVQREVELTTFLHADARAALARHGVELSSWAGV